MSEERNLLLERVKQYGIILPKCQPVFDRIFIYKIPGEEKLEGSSIIMPGNAFHNADRGVLVYAGLRALDELKSHGIDLGHIVWYARLSPWQRRYAGVGLQEGRAAIGDVVVLRASEIVGSEDLWRETWEEGKYEIAYDSDNNQHYFRGLPPRTDPATSDEGI